MLFVPPQNTPAHEQFPGGEISRNFGKTWWLYFAGLGGSVNNPLIRYGTAADRAALDMAKVQDGTLFWETDTGLVYQAQKNAAGTLLAWVYFSGTYQRTQSQLTALAATLGANDADLPVEVTDYRHILRWTGTAWECAAGEVLGGFIQGFAVDPDPTTGWQYCDGTATTYLKKDGTTGNFTTPDLTSAANKAAYLKLGTPVAGPTAATAPAFTGTPVTPTGTVSAIAATPTAPMTSAVAAGQNTANNTHTHPAPTVTINAITPAGTVDATGEPRNYELRPWFRK